MSSWDFYICKIPLCHQHKDVVFFLILVLDGFVRIRFTLGLYLKIVHWYANTLILPLVTRQRSCKPSANQHTHGHTSTYLLKNR